MVSSNSTVSSILANTLAGERLTQQDALTLLESRELAAIGAAANEKQKR